MSTHGRFGVWTGLAVMVAMIGALATAVTAAGQQGPGGPAWQRQGMGRGGAVGPLGGGPGMPGFGRGLRQLDLSAEQREQVKAIREAHRDEFRALAERGTPVRRALADAIESGDEAAIRKHSAELAAVQTDRALLAARVHEEIAKILTPEQQQKAKELRDQIRQQQRQQQRQERRQAPRG